MSCLRAARAVRDTLLVPHPEADFDLHAVWIEVLVGDDAEHARKALPILSDRRTRAYHDPRRRAGRALAPLIGIEPMRAILERLDVPPENLFDSFQRDFVLGEACLFDTVFFFGPDASWAAGGPPPQPAAWATQLDAHTFTGIDPERAFWGDALREELAGLAREHVAESAPAQEPGGE